MSGQPWRPVVVCAFLLVLLAVALPVAMAFGAEALPVGRVVDALRGGGDLATRTIVLDLRLPRSLLAIVVGAGLAIAGVAVQTLVRNPLADPYLLGVTSGASVGATAVITTGALAAFGVWSLSVGAFIGALAAGVLVAVVTLSQGGLTPLRLILSGTVLGSALSAIASYLVFRSGDPAAAQSVLFWLLGSLAGGEWDRLWLPAAVVAASFVLLWAASGWLDAMAVGPDTAAALGVSVPAVRAGLFTLLALLVGVLVAVAGAVAFVGLVLPHVARLLVGARHRLVLPAAALSGGLFLLAVDVVARIAVRPTEVPLSVVTGIVGAPVFLVLMGRRRYSFGAAS
ncbi:iron ABC transporter permease [Pseudonocardia sp. N23]|uniref:FecCD family ABC transporter permease n=1 Tax=Pseudonocardia sp. N23 TaxID=1987376 RepID=UPI000BFC5FD5|nr:iron ABC transporter permease [Pseudonocardia sp. N23]GAY07111.1 ABC transporter (iron.B12.siderophore.hemin), permease component [Pseudonocardia sp. N23]